MDPKGLDNKNDDKAKDLEGLMILQIYPENKIEVNNSKELKFSDQGINFVLENDFKNGLKVTYFESSNTKNIKSKTKKDWQSLPRGKETCRIDLRNTQVNLLFQVDFKTNQLVLKNSKSDCIRIDLNRKLFKQ
jgi:hypothetical protein